MHSSTFRLTAFAGLLALTGCAKCGDKLQSAIGEVAYVNGDQLASSALVQFPPTPKGGRSTRSVVLKNIGRGALTIDVLTKESGAPITLGDAVDPNAIFNLQYLRNDTVAGDATRELVVTFAPPVDGSQPFIDYETRLTLHAIDATEPTTDTEIIITGRAVADECELPSVLDFGSVMVGSVGSRRLDFSNQGVADIQGFAGDVSAADGTSVFAFESDSARGTFPIEAGRTQIVGFGFSPTEAHDYTALVKLRRSNSCPVVTVRLKGRGVNTCLTWLADPAEDAAGQRLHFGYVAPMSTGPGTVTFTNVCSFPIELQNLRGSDPVFTVTQAGVGDLTRLTVPAAVLGMDGMWAPSSAWGRGCTGS